MNIYPANSQHRFDPPLLADVPLATGWHYGSLRTTAAAGHYSKIDRGPGDWLYTPREISFKLTFVDGGTPLQISFENYSITCDAKFPWPTIGNSSPVVAHFARDRIGGRPACALTGIRREDGPVGRVVDPGTGGDVGFR